MDEQQKKPREGERRRLGAPALRCCKAVQPGLAGLMDGSVSTLAPVFAGGCFVTHQSRDAFRWRLPLRGISIVSAGFLHMAFSAGIPGPEDWFAVR